MSYSSIVVVASVNIAFNDVFSKVILSRNKLKPRKESVI